MSGDYCAKKEIILNGTWQWGFSRNYDNTCVVPGIITNPKQMSSEELWLKKIVKLPDENFTHATLLLKGARFCPRIYINGDFVSEKEGGMTFTKHLLKHDAVKPGEEIEVEISLQSLKDIPETDASRIPEADWWRSNVSSCLWDDVVLLLHSQVIIEQVTPFTDFENRLLTVFSRISFAQKHDEYRLSVSLQNDEGEVIAEHSVLTKTEENRIALNLPNNCKPWFVESGNVYQIIVTTEYDNIQSQKRVSYGLKDFRVNGKKFTLNNSPVTLRATTIVWHRWVRDEESRLLAFDSQWFEQNIVDRLRQLGGNTVRFHLGIPPEEFLNICDRKGVMVQLEWSFFHGIKGSPQSLLKQWGDFFDLAVVHPCVCIIHPWNETEGEDLSKAFETIEKLSPLYPPLVISHRDVLHIHRYWWSLFENVGIYYDSAEQFEKPIMVDEFGGNYLDGECNYGGYKKLNESGLRFLGKDHTKKLRLQLHTESNAVIAEYWRRIGAAGFSPFCALGSWEDGNHHFMGPLSYGIPKPVWGACTAAYAPVSVSIELWDRHFACGQNVNATIFLFNETSQTQQITCELYISNVDTDASLYKKETITKTVNPFETIKVPISYSLPNTVGQYRLNAKMIAPDLHLSNPVKSSWRVFTYRVTIPPVLKDKKFYIINANAELECFLTHYGLCNISSMEQADIIIGSHDAFEHIINNAELKARLETYIEQGKHILLTNIGPQFLGLGYWEGGDAGPLLTRPKAKEVQKVEYDLLRGIIVDFQNLPEPESCLHPTEHGNDLWNNLDKQSLWLSNGYRGNLNVPASDMEVSGLNQQAFLQTWQARGADVAFIQQGDYIAYEMAGFYAFTQGPQEQIAQRLQEKVKFLVDDAPALQNAIDINAPIQIIHLSKLYEKIKAESEVKSFPLICCGKNLCRFPVVKVSFGNQKGSLILSQLLTEKRLNESYADDTLYGVHSDIAIQQLMLNLLEELYR